MRFVSVKRFAELSGYTEKAVYHKIADGVWLENRHFRRAPDNRILMDVERLKKVSAKTVNNNLTALGGLYELAVSDGVATRNPTLLVKSQKHQKPEPDPFSRLEMELIRGYQGEYRRKKMNDFNGGCPRYSRVIPYFVHEFVHGRAAC